jgi:hypothetical protein
MPGSMETIKLASEGKKCKRLNYRLSKFVIENPITIAYQIHSLHNLSHVSTSYLKNVILSVAKDL